jgi:hypothetical protein
VSIKSIITFVIFISLIAVATSFLPSLAWSISNFNDIDDQKINSGFGTIEFRVKLLKDISKDPHNHVLLLAVSSDLKEFYKVEIVEEKMIVWRDFGGCLRAAFSSPYNFKIGDWHNIKVTWNRSSTKAYIDNKEIKNLGLFSGQDSKNTVVCIRLGAEESLKTEGFKATSYTDIRVDPKDEAFAKNTKPPNLKAILKEPIQEQYRGISLYHFPNQASRNKMKSHISLLPADFSKAVKNIIYVEDERFPKGGEGGLAESDSMSAFLKGSYFDNPTVCFHELAHLYDFKLSINFGVSNKSSEWAAISGHSCYYGGADMDEFAKNFEKTKSKNAFLAGQGGQCPSEDLAIWVAAAYDYYLKSRSFSDMMDPSSPKYTDKAKKKLDFIFKKGFISQEIFNKITSK